MIRERPGLVLLGFAAATPLTLLLYTGLRLAASDLDVTLCGLPRASSYPPLQLGHALGRSFSTLRRWHLPRLLNVAKSVAAHCPLPLY